MKRTLLLAAVTTAVALAASAPFVRAQATAPATQPTTQPDTNPHLWKPRTTSVSVFKNGMGFFVREADVSLRDGWAVTEEIPPAAFGTFAIYSHGTDETVDMVGSGPGEVVEFDGKDAPDTTAAKRARLESSKHLNLQVTYKQKGLDRSASGKVVSIGPEYAVLEKDGNNSAVPIDGITKLQVLDLPVRVHVTKDGNRPIDKTKLGMAYLRKGVTWIPEYTLRVIDEENAEITLRGTFVNEAEDLVHADVNFVVGVPNFVHAEYMAPIAVGQVIRTIGAAVAPAQVQMQISNRAAFANDINNGNFNAFDVVTRGAAAPGDIAAATAGLPRLDSAAGTDFTKKDVTLRRGEKAIVSLFTAKIKYGHLYRWDAPAAMKHMIVLKNVTDTAWTTGPLLALSKGQPLSEDLLTYTPKAGVAEIPVTSSINVAQDQVEQETARKLKDYSPNNGTSYLDLVTLSGKLTVKNFEKQPVDVIVNVNVAGKPIEASDSGNAVTDTKNLTLLTRSGSVKWTLKIAPGETKAVTYKYERYVASN